MKWCLRWLLFIFCVLGAEAGNARNGYLVGVYYFAGWWENPPNKWMLKGHDWRPDFPGRIPLLGQFNNQATMDREIVAASEHGVDFFQILWYPNGGLLNEGLRTFLASTNSGRMKFTIEFVNHPPFGNLTDRQWRTNCEEWCRAMKNPSYLKVDGRPVFKIHGMDFFFQQNDRDLKKVRARLDIFRRIALENNVGNPLISAGVSPMGIPPADYMAAYDFVTTYMDVPNLPRQSAVYSYEILLKDAQEGWVRYAEHSSKPYVPYLPAGWDPRPWNDLRASFAFPTRAEWTDALRKVKTALDQYTNLGVPSVGGRQKMVLIYAWNEFGEGGFIAPTAGEGEMRLDVIRDVFEGQK